ncbi:hypothetical protein FJT64_013239 [Amphibalanus amphitrite]|uniref:Uncharacterized protein n=1 Tax=Amphibalanus amphitrite TaxID=1232801 RepID=A0A6A4V5F0_AMPAM|nr:hypothetical protein FJT64_013239 [Amphibalanus amphitrite]
MQSLLLLFSEPLTSCKKKCPTGQECKLVRKCWKGLWCFSLAACVDVQPPAPSGPPSCQAIRCAGTQVCVLQEVVCAAVTQPCYPVPVCIDDPCALALCGQPGTRCVTQRRPDAQPACTPFPGCQFTSACVPRARPKPGFCPAASLVPADSVKRVHLRQRLSVEPALLPRRLRQQQLHGARVPEPLRQRDLRPRPARPAAWSTEWRGVWTGSAAPGPDSYFCQNNTQTFCSQSAAIIRT